MKKYLTIFLFISCTQTQKRPEPVKEMAYGVTNATLQMQIVSQGGLINQLLKKDSLRDKQILIMQKQITKDSLKMVTLTDSFNISDTTGYDPLYYKVNQLRPHYTFITKP